MAKKRKSVASRLDEVDRSMYTTFCNGANSLSQLYTQAMHQQKLSIQAGERQALEKLYTWILRQQEDGVRVMTGDIISYIQNELDYGTEDPPPSPRLPLQQHQQSQISLQLSHSGVGPAFSNAFGATPVGQGLRSDHSDQTKNPFFSSSLSSPVRRSLQHYHRSQGGYYASNGTRSIGNSGSQIRDINPPSSNDSSMDMHADAPGHISPY